MSPQTFLFRACSVGTAGVLVASGGIFTVDGQGGLTPLQETDPRPVCVETKDHAAACVTSFATAVSGGSTWRVQAYRANSPSLQDVSPYSSAVEISGATNGSRLFKVESRLLVLVCTVAEASNAIDVYVHLRGDHSSSIPS